MKKIAWVSLLILTLIVALAACGGGAPAETTIENQAPAESETVVEATPIADTSEEAAGPTTDAGAESAATEVAAPAEAQSGGDTVAGLPASGTDPDTGLEINPPGVVPGVAFIVRGEIVNANLTPQDSPGFVILSPSGTRYRIRSQHVNDITFEDGEKPALHEFKRGVLIQATVQQAEDAGETITVQSSDLMLLHSD
jgi:hypothetical protein